MQFQKNVVISGTIICTTGLSIGGTDVSIDIGGVDKIVVRDPISGLPYIPGSSLKGKMRSLLELAKGKISNDGKPCNCGKCVVCKIFGISANVKKEQKGPTRLIVRDSFPTKETSEKWKNIETLISGAEVKAENWINRITSEAKPRHFERIPKDSKFEFEMIFSIYENDDLENFKTIFETMKLLEDSYLGGSGTRGYGKIRFRDIDVVVREKGYYDGGEEEKSIKTKKTVEEILKDENLVKKIE